MKIIESKTFEVVFNHLTKSSLLILDLDNTLIESKHQYGSYQWGHFLVQQAMAKGCSLNAAIDRVMPQWNRAQYDIEIVPIEDTIFDWLKKAHSMGAQTLALTGRSADIAPITIEKLRNLGFNFSDWSHLETHFTSHKNMYLERGVLFVGSKNCKGAALKKLLKHHQRSIEKIIFLDDQLHYLEQVAATTLDLKVPFLGVHFTKALEKVEGFNFQIAEEERKKLTSDIEQ